MLRGENGVAVLRRVCTPYSTNESPTLSFKSASLTGREVRGRDGREGCGVGVGSVSVAIVLGGVGRLCTEVNEGWNRGILQLPEA